VSGYLTAASTLAKLKFLVVDHSNNVIRSLSALE
jgi:hypothetical protein